MNIPENIGCAVLKQRVEALEATLFELENYPEVRYDFEVAAKISLSKGRLEREYRECYSQVKVPFHF